MRKILIDLDTLFDTRLALVAKLDPLAATYIAQHTAYWDRDHTDWAQLTDGRLTNAMFEEAWATRDKQVLKQSIITGILVVLLRLIAEDQQGSSDGEPREALALEINVHPYGLDVEEMEELTALIHETIDDELPITFCSRPIEELTPQVLDANYALVILYEFHRWIKQHCFALSKHRCPDLHMLAPKLFEKNPAELTMQQRQDEIVGFRLWTTGFINIDFIDAEWFSMFRPQRPAAK